MAGAPSLGVIQASLLVLHFIGAANAGASEEQRERLRTEVLPLMKDESLTASEAYKAACEKAQEIRGADWEPEGEWAVAINALLGEKP